MVATNTVNVVGSYYNNDGYYVYESVQSAIADMPDTTENNRGIIAITNNITENIVINSGAWYMSLFGYTITAAETGSAVITNNGTLMLILVVVSVVSVPILVKLSTEVSDAEYYASLTLKDNIDIKLIITGFGSGFDADKLAVFVDNSEITGLTYDESDGKVIGILKSVVPKNMADSMRVVITYDGVSINMFDYSVRMYCESVFNDTEHYGVDSKLGQLCKAVLNYGKYAADYFNEKENNGAAASTVNSGYEIDFTDTTVNVTATSVTNDKTVVTKASAYLALDSNIILNFKLATAATLNKDNIIITCNGSSVSADDITLSAAGGSYTVTIKNINASDISNTYTLTIDNVSDFEIIYGIYNYCASIQRDKYTAEDGYTDTLKTLCKAIYNYGEAARAYVNK